MKFSGKKVETLLFPENITRIEKECGVQIKNITELKQGKACGYRFTLSNMAGLFKEVDLLFEKNTLFLYIDSKYILQKKGILNYVQALQYAVSFASIEYFSFQNNELSCREDTYMLDQYTKNGILNISANYNEWIESNSFMKRLLQRKLYKNILNFTMNIRGLFIKNPLIPYHKNYFNSSVNGGMPIIRKSDETHEGTFMLHDIIHFLFLDPLVTGEESEAEKSLYIAARMMGEACSLVLADMMGVSHSGVESEGYDITKRKILPLLYSTGLDANILDDLKVLMYENAKYCLYGDSSGLRGLVLEGSDVAFQNYSDKYSIFFAGDLYWNKQNINSIFYEYSRNPKMQEYFNCTFFESSHYTVKELGGLTFCEGGGFSFEKLFEIFWKQFEEVIKYEEDFNLLKHKKSVSLKYLSGQLLLRYKYGNILSAYHNLGEFDILFQEGMNDISNASEVEEVYRLFKKLNTIILEFIDTLEKEVVLLPHEVFSYKLHVNHFPPEFIYYESKTQPFGSLDSISTQVLGKSIICNNSGPLLVDSKLQETFIKKLKL